MIFSSISLLHIKNRTYIRKPTAFFAKLYATQHKVKGNLTSVQCSDLSLLWIPNQTLPSSRPLEGLKIWGLQGKRGTIINISSLEGCFKLAPKTWGAIPPGPLHFRRPWSQVWVRNLLYIARLFQDYLALVGHGTGLHLRALLALVSIKYDQVN